MPETASSAADLVRRVFHAFKRRLDQNPDRLPLTHAQASVLFYLYRAESQGKRVSPSDLEEGLHLSRPTVTGLLQRLESRGFIAAQPDPEDKRYKLLHTTDAFEAHHKLMEDYMVSQQKLLLKGFTPQEEDLLKLFLTRMLNNLEEGGEPHA